MIARQFAATAALGLALASPAAMSQSTDWPQRPIKIVVAFPPGGAADVVARTVGEQMARDLGQPVIIDNRPGANSTVASAYVANAKPDGYTLYIGSMNLHGLDKILYPTIKYDGNRDFTPIARWVSSPMVVAVPAASKIDSLAALIEQAKRSPDALNYATSGVGSVQHQATISFMQATGAKLYHVPYKGGAAAVASLMSGDSQVIFATPPSVASLVKAGSLKALATTTKERSPLFANLPSSAESGVAGYEYRFWYGLYAPAGLDRKIADKVFESGMKALQNPEVRKSLEMQGMEVAPSKSIDEFEALIKKDGPSTAELGKSM